MVFLCEGGTNSSIGCLLFYDIPREKRKKKTKKSARNMNFLIAPKRKNQALFNSKKLSFFLCFYADVVGAIVTSEAAGEGATV